jgi:hypothetical protein
MSTRPASPASGVGRVLPFAQRSRRLHTDWQLPAKNGPSQSIDERLLTSEESPFGEATATERYVVRAS